VPLSLANLLVAGLLGKLTYDAQLSPTYTFIAFLAGNIALLAVMDAGFGWWRGRERSRAVTFEPVAAGEGASR
jgi:hypothetical protein